MVVDPLNQKPEESQVDSISCKFACSPLFNRDGKCFSHCFKVCPDVCKTLVVDGNLFHPFPDLPPPPPPPPPMRVRPPGDDLAHKANQKNLVSTALTLAACIIGVFLAFGICCAILRFYYNRQRNSRRARSAPMFFGTQEDFLVEDQEPEVDHPIWYINTVGLQQSVIDSISVFTYKKDELLIEGTECSVCLNAFQEDESLRLLPKCSHAFHIPCIDTWLRSHKNCPLCRAPIVSDNFDAQSDLSVASSSGLSSREDTQVGNSQSGPVVTSSQLGEGAARNESGIGDGEFVVSLPVEEDEAAAGNSKMRSSDSVLRNHSRVRSDVPDSRQAMEAEMQPIRRSVSMDSSSALAIYRAVANAVPGKRQVNSDSQLAQLKKSKNVAKRGSAGSLSFGKLVKSSSIGRALQKGPVSMKRSFSSSGKASSSSSRHTRSHDSVLPL